MDSLPSPHIKIVILGEAAVGKTSFVRSLWSDFEDRYIATIGVEVSHFDFHTNQGRLSVSVWDTAGQEKLSGLRDEYVIGAQGVVVVTDVKSGSERVEPWVRIARSAAGMVPIVVAGNKLDAVMENDVVKDPPRYTVAHDLPYVQMSSKSRTDTTVPFELLLRQIRGLPDLAVTQIIKTG